MHFVVTGGGTGGHAFPALELAKEFQSRNKNIFLTWVGNKNSIEERLAKKNQINFFALSSKQFVGQNIFKKFLALFFLGLNTIFALFFLLRKRPNAIISVGGYVSAPIMFAGYLLGVKKFTCEQNVVPGKANKIFGRISENIFTSFKDSDQYFEGDKTKIFGNPVRKEFFLHTKTFSQDTLRLLVVGGSQGARFLNLEIPKALETISKECPNIAITHQCGAQMKSNVENLYKKYTTKYSVEIFIEDMPKVFSDHDLIISRAGATICAEICAAKMPAILVPYRFAGGHQKYNALSLSEKGAALTIYEDEKFASTLAETVKKLYSDREQLASLSAHAGVLAHEDAAKNIVGFVLKDQKF